MLTVLALVFIGAVIGYAFRGLIHNEVSKVGSQIEAKVMETYNKYMTELKNKV